MRADRGIATTIGIVLLVGAVFIMGAGAAVVLTEHDEPAAPTARGFHVANDADGIRVLLTRGEPIPTATASLFVITNDGDQQRALSVIGEGLGDTWESSEQLCLLGVRPGCAHGIDPDAFQGFRLVAQDQAIYEWFGTPALERTTAQSSNPGTGGQAPQGGNGPDGDDGEEEADDGQEPADTTGPAEGPATPTGQPDLVVSIEDTSPANPVHGDQVVFTVTVRNQGTAATEGPFDVRVYVGDTLVSSDVVAATGPSQTRTVTSDPWTATTGEHTVSVEVDVPDDSQESDEQNNRDQDALSVETGHADPGHAYEDVDNDVRFTEGLDIAIPDAEVLDGAYEVSTPAHGLVVPASVGNITAEAIHLQAGSDGHLVLGTNLNATQAALRLTAGTHLNATSVSIRSQQDLVNLTAGATLNVTGTEARADTVLHLNANGDVWIADGRLRADTLVEPRTGNKVLICHYPPGHPENVQTIEVAESAVDTHAGHHGDYRGACVFEDGILISTGTSNATVYVAGATIEDPDDTAVVVPMGATVAGTPDQGAVEVHDPEPIEEDH